MCGDFPTRYCLSTLRRHGAGNPIEPSRAYAGSEALLAARASFEAAAAVAPLMPAVYFSVVLPGLDQRTAATESIDRQQRAALLKGMLPLSRGLIAALRTAALIRCGLRSF